MAKAKKPASKATGLSLHIGLNSVDPDHYEGWAGPLGACEQDAKDMAAIARARGVKTPKVLLTSDATRSKTFAGIKAAAKKLKRGDFFLLTYSGHGGQIRDVTGEEEDRRDETWCLFDGQLIDDELYFELSRFGTGVRILVLSDSCHSGTVNRGEALQRRRQARASGSSSSTKRRRALTELHVESPLLTADSDVSGQKEGRS